METRTFTNDQRSRTYFINKRKAEKKKKLRPQPPSAVQSIAVIDSVDEYIPPMKVSPVVGDLARLVTRAAMGDLEEVEKCVRLIPCRDLWWEVALRKAAANGHHEVVNMMLQKAKGRKNRRWRSVLHTAAQFAAQNGHTKVLTVLLANGAPTNLLGSESPINIAIRKGHAQVVRALLTAGSPPSGVAYEESPLSLARSIGNVTIVSIISTHASHIPAPHAPKDPPERPRIPGRPPFFSRDSPAARIHVTELQETRQRSRIEAQQAALIEYIVIDMMQR